MAVDLPDVNQLARDFFNGLRSRRGEAVQYERLKVWDGWASGLSRLALRTLLITGRRFDASFLDRCAAQPTPDALDDYCRSRGPVRRFGAVKAKGPLSWSRPTTGAGAGTVLAGTEIRVPYKGTSYLFTVDADTSISSTSTTLVTNVTASVAGAASNVGGGVAAGLSLTGNGPAMFDATLLPLSVSLSRGADAETNAELAERQRLWEQSRERATEAAIAYGAFLVNGVKHVVTAKAFDSRIGGFGYVYVGDTNWNSTQDLRDDVAASLESWRGLTATQIASFANSDVTVTATILMARPVALYDATAIKAAASSALLSYFNARVDPYSYDITMVRGRIARAHDEIAGVTLTTPTTSVASPLTPSAIRAAGGLPSILTRYRLQASNIFLSIVGPT